MCACVLQTRLDQLFFSELYSASRVSHVVVNDSKAVRTLLRQEKQSTASMIHASGAESDRTPCTEDSFLASGTSGLVYRQPYASNHGRKSMGQPQVANWWLIHGQAH